MNSAARSALSAAMHLLTSAGHQTHVPSGRQRRKGFALRAHGYSGAPGWSLFLHDMCKPGEFEQVCKTLTNAGYMLSDCTPAHGQDYVRTGCARVVAPA